MQNNSRRRRLKAAFTVLHHQDKSASKVLRSRTGVSLINKHEFLDSDTTFTTY